MFICWLIGFKLLWFSCDRIRHLFGRKLGVSMNDFTKTELSEIKRCLKYMIDGGTTPYSCLTMSLHKKVRQMIEKYCEIKTPKVIDYE